VFEAIDKVFALVSCLLSIRSNFQKRNIFTNLKLLSRGVYLYLSHIIMLLGCITLTELVPVHSGMP